MGMKILKNSCDFENYVQCFYSFLDAHKLRRSAERNAVLRAVFHFDRHFTVEELQCRLKQQKYHVSRSTLYTTLGLLMDAGLVFKHRLSSQTSPQYEKFYGTDAHNHVYMEGLEKMLEFSDERIEEIKKEIAEKYQVEVVNHAFILYCRKNEK